MRSRLAIVAATVLALAFIIYLASQELHALRDGEQTRARGQAQEITEAVRRALDETKASLRAVLSTLEASQTLTEREFAALVEGLGVFEYGDHLRAIAVMPLIAHGELADLNRRIALNVEDRGDMGYPEWRPVEPSDRETYAPVVFAIAPSGVESIVGYDLASSPDRLSTGLRAREAGAIRMTAPVTLSQDSESDDRSVLLIGFTEQGRLGYRNGLIENRPYPTIVAISYTPGRHLARTFDAVNFEAFSITVTDVTDPSAPVTIHARGAGVSEPPIHVGRLEVAGRIWSIEYRKPLDSLTSFVTPRIVLASLVGAVMVLFCGFAAYRISQNESVLQRRVAMRTAELEEARDQINEALRDAERANQAKTEFLATMSHEFRTPLNAILGFSDVIQSQIFGEVAPSRYQGYARDIHESGKHMLQLVDDILDLSAIEVGALDLRFEPTDVSRMVRDLAPICREVAAGRDMKLTLDLSDTLPEVEADPRSIKQIIMNLVSNAVKYSAPGTEVEIATRATKDAVQLRVRDRGVGIPSEKIDRLLQPFVRGVTNPHISAEGAGLGLSIVSVLITHHNGTLTIDSTVGEGTVVTVSLPAG